MNVGFNPNFLYNIEIQSVDLGQDEPNEISLTQVKKIVSKDGLALQLYPQYNDSWTVVKKAINNNPMAWQYLSSEKKKSWELAQTAVKLDGLVLEQMQGFSSNKKGNNEGGTEYCDNWTLCHQAFIQNSKAYEFCSKRIQKILEKKYLDLVSQIK